MAIRIVKNLCRRIGVSEKGYVENLTQPLIKQISRNINVECMIERELQAIILANINNKIKTKSYQGIRHLNGLPVNGQNTRNNSQTAKKLLKENANKVKKN